MVKGHRDLDQPLQKLALRFGRLPPDILKRFVGFKELGSIEQPDALAKKTIRMAVKTLFHRSRSRGCLMTRGRVKKARNNASSHQAAGFAALALFLTGAANHNTLINIP